MTEDGAGDARARGLSTARAVLRVLTMLARTPDGVRADRVAAELGKSVSTAYNVLWSLCEEGVAAHHPGGVFKLTPHFEALISDGRQARLAVHDLRSLVDEVLARTHKRSYLALVESGHLRIVLVRGQQGMPRMPGLEAEIGDNAHALAIGKLALAHAGAAQIDRYLRPGLRGFTPRTIVEPAALRLELAAVRRAGVATDREEFRTDFCGIAAPLMTPQGGFIGAAGISMTAHAFDAEHAELAQTVRDAVWDASRPRRDTARLQHRAETSPVLDDPSEPDLRSVGGRRARRGVAAVPAQRRWRP